MLFPVALNVMDAFFSASVLISDPKACPERVCRMGSMFWVSGGFTDKVFFYQLFDQFQGIFFNNVTGYVI